LAGFGLTVRYELLQLHSGLDGEQTLQLVAPDLRQDERKKMLEDQGRIFSTKYLERVKAFTEVRHVFDTLSKGGGRIALATDCEVRN